MISAEQIKELRERTGAGFSDIKKALEESGGKIEEAVRLIEKALGSIAGKKASRETRAGVVDSYIHSNGRIGVLVEVFCETDFVARNPGFKEFAHDLAMHIAAMEPEDTDTLLAQPFIKDPGKAIEVVLKEAIGRFGENIKIGRFTRFEL